MKGCSICETWDRLPVVHPAATEKDDGCPYVKKSEPASSVEVRLIMGRLGYWVYDGATVIELFDYWHNAMHFAKRFAKALNKGPVRYVREKDASPTK